MLSAGMEHMPTSSLATGTGRGRGTYPASPSMVARTAHKRAERCDGERSGAVVFKHGWVDKPRASTDGAQDFRPKMNMKMILLAHGPLFVIDLMFGFWCVIGALFASPGFLMQRRDVAALVSMVVGVLMSSVGFAWGVWMISGESAFEWSGMVFGLLCAASVAVGCYGVWRWFRLPRR